jgi:Tfp pilus assembly protein PilX
MSKFSTKQKQRGVTLFVGLVMLVLITVMVTSAYSLSNTNLKSVNNMQTRNEAISAANVAIEQILDSPFTNSPTAEEINIDINNDGITDYVVNIETPVCIRAAIDSTSPGAISSITLGAGLSAAATSSWNTMWEINAVVTDVITGAATRVRSGTQVLLDQTQKDLVCA